MGLRTQNLLAENQTTQTATSLKPQVKHNVPKSTKTNRLKKQCKQVRRDEMEYKYYLGDMCAYHPLEQWAVQCSAVQCSAVHGDQLQV